MPRTVFEFKYDLRGQMPDRIFVPHMALRISHPGSEGNFDTAMLLDTGATSDITIAKASAKTITKHMGKDFEWTRAGISAGPLSMLKAKTDYSHHSLRNRPIADAARLQRSLNTLRKGSKDVNTMSLAYFAQIGNTILLDPGAGNDKTIKEFFNENEDGPVRVYSNDLGFPGAFPTMQFTVKASAASELRIETAIGGVGINVVTNVCWDTGAWKCCVPKRQLQALGVYGDVVPKISVQSAGGNIVSFLNVPVETRFPEILIGANLFTILRTAIQPGIAGRMGFTVLRPATSVAQVVLPFEGWT